MVHSSVTEFLFTLENCKYVEEQTENCILIVDDEKRHLCVSFDDETHGLVFVNKVKGGNKGYCQGCKSVRCKHIQIWNKEMKKKVFKDTLSPVKDLEAGVEKEEMSENFVTGNQEENIEIFSSQRLEYPYNKETQQKMREADGTQYNNLIELVSMPEDDEKCEHGRHWSKEDPREKGWVY